MALWTSSPRRFLIVFLLALTGLTPISAPLSAQPAPLPKDPGDLSFLDALELTREVYRLWGGGREREAVLATSNLNVRLAEHLPCWHEARLAFTLLAADDEPELLAPAGRLAVDTLALHQQRGDGELVLGELGFIDALVGELGEAATTPEQRELHEHLALRAAGLRTQIRDEDSLLVAQRSLDEFLATRPDHPMGLRLRGGVDELQGQHARAAGFLRRAVETAPAASPLRLRLALNLLRAGDDDSAEAETLLRELAAGPADSWVTVVAAQEAARQIARDRDQGPAEALAFLGTLPAAVATDPDLALLADFLARRPAREGDTARLLAAASSDATDDEDPRYLYDRGPFDELELDAAALEPRLTELAARLGAAADALHRDPDLLRSQLLTIKTARKALARCPHMSSAQRRNIAVGMEAPMP